MVIREMNDFADDIRGSYEWKGDWGDESNMWAKYPGIKYELQDIHSCK
jgi:hypothetical protein